MLKAKKYQEMNWGINFSEKFQDKIIQQFASAILTQLENMYMKSFLDVCLCPAPKSIKNRKEIAFSQATLWRRTSLQKKKTK